MAFSTAEQASIRRYLGFSALFGDVDTRLQQQMIILPTRSPDDEVQVRGILNQLAQIDAKLLNAALFNLDAAKIDDAVMMGEAQLDALRNFGRTLIQQLAITFWTPPKADYYSTGALGGVINGGGEGGAFGGTIPW